MHGRCGPLSLGRLLSFGRLLSCGRLLRCAGLRGHVRPSGLLWVSLLARLVPIRHGVHETPRFP